MEFNYYYGSQADQFSFIRIPKLMLTDATFSGLSIPAKMLYGVLLDRMSLSSKNGWFDEENRVFIIYQIGEIVEDLGFTKKKAMDLLSELEKFGLLEKKRRGKGLPNILYVKSFLTGIAGERGDDLGTSADAAGRNRDAENGTSPVNLCGDRSAGSGTSHEDSGMESGTSHGDRGDESSTPEVPNPGPLEVLDRAPLEVPFSTPLKSNTYKNQTKLSDTESNHIVSPEEYGDNLPAQADDAMRCDAKAPSILDKTEAYRDLIAENIDLDVLRIDYPNDRELIDGIADLILEVVMSQSESIVIASNRYPTEIVRSRFLKLDMGHIQYVLRCLSGNTTKVVNIRKYLLAALFNAPVTIDAYYQAEVNHDMPYLAKAR